MANSKPVLTVSFAGYDQYYANLTTLSKLGGPNFAQMADGMLGLFTQGRGLAGLDKKRPWGALVYAAGDDDFPVVIFVPVTDFKKLVALIPDPETGQPTKPDDKGVCELKFRGQSFFAKEKDGWAFAVRKREDLDALPANPAALIDDLAKKYTLAIRASLKNVPAALKDKGLQAAVARLAGWPWPNEPAN